MPISPHTLLALGLAAALLGGCLRLPAVVLGGGTAQVHLAAEPEVDKKRDKERLFFAEFLEQSGTTTRRVGVFAERAEGPLALLLNPERFVSGEVGAATLGELEGRFAPLRLHAIYDQTGRRLGYAFLPTGRALRVISVKQDLYILDFIEK